MSVDKLIDCHLLVADRAWQFAVEHCLSIQRHWDVAVAHNPKLFDGDVFVVDRWALEDDKVLRGEVLRAKFSAYLYWRDIGFDCGLTHEAFATTCIKCRDGGVLLARSVAGTLNEGRYVSPGGLIDSRDVITCASGGVQLDLAGAAARELLEETGLRRDELRREDGFVLAQAAPFLAVCSVFHSDLCGVELKRRVEGFLGAQDEPELEDIRIINEPLELEQIPTTVFTRLLVKAVLA